MESSPEMRGTASVKFFRVNVKEKGKTELNEFHIFEFCRKTNLNSSFVYQFCRRMTFKFQLLVVVYR